MSQSACDSEAVSDSMAIDAVINTPSSPQQNTVAELEVHRTPNPTGDSGNGEMPHSSSTADTNDLEHPNDATTDASLTGTAIDITAEHTADTSPIDITSDDAGIDDDSVAIAINVMPTSGSSVPLLIQRAPTRKRKPVEDVNLDDIKDPDTSASQTEHATMLDADTNGMGDSDTPLLIVYDDVAYACILYYVESDGTVVDPPEAAHNDTAFQLNIKVMLCRIRMYGCMYAPSHNIMIALTRSLTHSLTHPRTHSLHVLFCTEMPHNRHRVSTCCSENYLQTLHRISWYVYPLGHLQHTAHGHVPLRCTLTPVCTSSPFFSPCHCIDHTIFS
jgi:hypothetical protein